VAILAHLLLQIER